jgi:hypothetical protein
MKGTRFETIASIQQTVTRQLKAAREDAFSGAINSFYERSIYCAEAGEKNYCINNFLFLYGLISEPVGEDFSGNQLDQLSVFTEQHASPSEPQ